jgi:hypothetical protein
MGLWRMTGRAGVGLRRMMGTGRVWDEEQVRARLRRMMGTGWVWDEEQVRARG